jgi:DNA-nicking Smr family endonuclease
MPILNSFYVYFMSVTKEIPCTKEGLSHVIGKQGSTIKQIKSESGAEISSEDGPVLKVTGEQEQVDKATEMITKILADQADPDYEGPEGKKLRAEANHAGDERSRLMTEATAKFDAGEKDEGHKLMAEAKIQGELMHTKNEEAARAIVKHLNSGKGDNFLDLHGLRVDEAIKLTEERLDELAAKDATTILELIPGAGHHSAPGKVALKPACEELLKKRGLAYEVASAGSFNVTVVGKSGEAAPPATAPTATAESTTAEADKKEEEAPVHGEEKKNDEKKKEEGRACCIMM